MKRLAKATGSENYNILQNNGRLAHQEVDHVCIFITLLSGYQDGGLTSVVGGSLPHGMHKISLGNSHSAHV